MFTWSGFVALLPIWDSYVNLVWLSSFFIQWRTWKLKYLKNITQYYLLSIFHDFHIYFRVYIKYSFTKRNLLPTFVKRKKRVQTAIEVATQLNLELIFRLIASQTRLQMRLNYIFESNFYNLNFFIFFINYFLKLFFIEFN